MRTLHYSRKSTKWDILSILDASPDGSATIVVIFFCNPGDGLESGIDAVQMVVSEGFATVTSLRTLPKKVVYILSRSANFRSLHEALPMVQLLLPMGGLGTRFQAVGITTPKPLIDVKGIPMFRRAVSSFEGIKGAPVRVLFVVRTDHMKEPHNLDQGIISAYPGAVIVPLDHDTGGAVETCLQAADALYKSRPLIVLDCDLHTKSKGYETVLQRMVNAAPGDGPGGVLLTFESRAARYSYAAVAEDGIHVTRTAEKDPSISNRAVIGAYGFRSGEIFTKAARILMKRHVSEIKEYYLSLLYNILLQDLKEAVVMTVAEVYESFGTPDEMELYLAGKPSHKTE